jgi:hypothetical protein
LLPNTTSNSVPELKNMNGSKNVLSKPLDEAALAIAEVFSQEDPTLAAYLLRRAALILDKHPCRDKREHGDRGRRPKAPSIFDRLFQHKG